MTITFFLLKFPVYSETFVINQIIFFIKKGHNVKIVSLSKGDLANSHELIDEYDLLAKTTFLLEESNSNSIKLLSRIVNAAASIFTAKGLKSLNIKKYGNDAKRLILCSILSKNKNSIEADIILAHFGPAGVFALKLRELGILKGKIATIFHGSELSQDSALAEYQKSYQHLFLNTELILPISYLWADKIAEMGCDRRKITVQRMGIDLEKFDFSPIKKIDYPIKIVSVARLTEKKGIDVAIRACNILNLSNIDFTYNIFGEGPLEKELNELIGNFNLNGKVILSGFKSQNEIRDILNDSNVFLLPSKTSKTGDMEGIPVALMEAMAIGVPVVSSYHSGIPELVKNEHSGWLVPENDYQALAAILTSLPERQVMVSQMLLNARSEIEINFNQEKIYSELANLLEHM